MIGCCTGNARCKGAGLRLVPSPSHQGHWPALSLPFCCYPCHWLCASCLDIPVWKDMLQVIAKIAITDSQWPVLKCGTWTCQRPAWDSCPLRVISTDSWHRWRYRTKEFSSRQPTVRHQLTQIRLRLVSMDYSSILFLNTWSSGLDSITVVLSNLESTICSIRRFTDTIHGDLPAGRKSKTRSFVRMTPDPGSLLQVTLFTVCYAGSCTATPGDSSPSPTSQASRWTGVTVTVPQWLQWE
jgi:hypothetical protein